MVLISQSIEKYGDGRGRYRQTVAVPTSLHRLVPGLFDLATGCRFTTICLSLQLRVATHTPLLARIGLGLS